MNFNNSPKFVENHQEFENTQINPNSIDSFVYKCSPSQAQARGDRKQMPSLRR